MIRRTTANVRHDHRYIIGNSCGRTDNDTTNMQMWIGRSPLLASQWDTKISFPIGRHSAVEILSNCVDADRATHRAAAMITHPIRQASAVRIRMTTLWQITTEQQPARKISEQQRP